MKTALITGINGQDGSYLAEFLLEKGYEVHGIVRRNSVSKNQTSRINHIFEHENLFIHYGNMLDLSSLIYVVKSIMPDEIYNLAAQSHVKISFDNPIYTTETIVNGTLNLLETIRLISPKSKMYQAGSSEMFGNSIDKDGFQRENTPMKPVSPYSCSKLYAHNLVDVYRDSYDLFLCNGILFNHECVTLDTPLIIKKNNMIDIQYISDIVPYTPLENKHQSYNLINENIFILDKNGNFTKITTGSAFLPNYNNDDYKIKKIVTHRGNLKTTNHHKYLDLELKSIKAKNLKVGNKLLHSIYPKLTERFINIEKDLAWVIGLFVADGNLGSKNLIGFTNNNKEYLKKCSDVLSKIGFECRYTLGQSGFSDNKVLKLRCLNNNNNSSFVDWLRKGTYAKDKRKKIPMEFFNSNIEIVKYFLDGYYAGDGTKFLGKRGEANDYVAFKTNSPLLMLGLNFLFDKIGYDSNQYQSAAFHHQYATNLYNRSKPISNKGNHLKKHPFEIKRISDVDNYNDWVFDLATESGTFVAGTGLICINNSPRRGENFVTNKVVKIAVEIKKGISKELALGNLNATRDWGHAKDYVKAMWMMLQHNKCDDYICASGESHSIHDLCSYVFNKLGLEYMNYIRVDRKYFRPSELHDLKGDAGKLRDTLNWKPEYTFETMLDEMIEYWLKYYEKN